MRSDVGTSVRVLRKALGVTQEDLGRAVGVTGCTVNRWEHGYKKPSRLASKALHDLARRHGLTFAAVVRANLGVEPRGATKKSGSAGGVS